MSMAKPRNTAARNRGAPGTVSYYHYTDHYLILSLQVAGTGVPDTDNVIIIVIIFYLFMDILQALIADK